jgi:large subunit ribosomal protein L34e
MAGKSINSRTKRRVAVKLPGNRTKVKITNKKPSRAVCASTGKPLQAVPQLKGPQIRRLSKSKRRPERPYGGFLSSKAMRKLFIKKAREESK